MSKKKKKKKLKQELLTSDGFIILQPIKGGNYDNWLKEYTRKQKQNKVIYDSEGFITLEPIKDGNYDRWLKSFKKKKKKQFISPINLFTAQRDTKTEEPKKDKEVEEEVLEDTRDQFHKDAMDKILLEVRQLSRKDIPKVDDGFSSNGTVDLSTEALHKFYRDHNVNPYLVPEGGNKFIKFNFDKVLDVEEDNEIVKMISHAEIGKQSFINNINLSVRYVNYFIEYWDDDDELMMAYYVFMLRIHMLDHKMTVEDFFDDIEGYFNSKSLIQKVIRMVEYNIEPSLVKSSDKSFDESIQLTIDHLKVIMCISCMHKIIIPIVSHYYKIHQKEVEAAGMTDKDFYLITFMKFIHKFDKYYDVDIHSKLYHTATTRISKTENRENVMWNRRLRLGTTPITFTAHLMRDYILDISQKAVFNKSAIIFIHVCFDKAIRTELIQSDKWEMSDMSMEPSDNVDETVSASDKMFQSKTFHSEKDRLRSYVTIEDAIKHIGRDFGLDFSVFDFDYYERSNQMRLKPQYTNGTAKPKEIKKAEALMDEYNYYLKNFPRIIQESQHFLIMLYCSNRLNNAAVADDMRFELRIMFIMIMKRDFFARNYSLLPFIISGNMVPSQVGKKCNKKKIEKYMEASPQYDELAYQFEFTNDLINREKILGYIRSIVTSDFIGCDYKYMEHFHDKTISIDTQVAVEEIVRFLVEI